MKRLIQDNDGHWYVIEEHDTESFNEWVEYMEDEGPVQLKEPEINFEDFSVDGPHTIYFEAFEER